MSSNQKFITPLKIGLLTVTISYFLFNLQSLFTLSWIGEWEGLPERVAFWIFWIDITANFFLIFRFFAGIVAVSAVILYFVRKTLPYSSKLKILRWILALEALYWFGLITSGIWGVLPTELGGTFSITLLLSTGIPCLTSSIVIPFTLFMLVSKLKPNKPQKQAIKWASITGTVYIFILWLNNSGMWIITALSTGTDYLIANPETLVSFTSTVFGLLALTLFTVYFTKKSMGTENIENLKTGTIGAIFTALGLYFLWNYLTWIFFGGWSNWYAWFLGHNLDLWLLSLPLVGLPLLLRKKQTNQSSHVTP
jgi:hypothetical protein